MSSREDIKRCADKLRQHMKDNVPAYTFNHHVVVSIRPEDNNTIIVKKHDRISHENLVDWNAVMKELQHLLDTFWFGLPETKIVAIVPIPGSHATMRISMRRGWKFKNFHYKPKENRMVAENSTRYEEQQHDNG